MRNEIQKQFRKVIINSLNTGQVNHLGELLDSNFDLHQESGFHPSIPIPQQTAAETLLRYFSDDDEIVELFTILLRHEGTRFYNTTLKVWGINDFIKLLGRNKWIFDHELIRFFKDPFYEHEINFLKKIQILDMREDFPVKETIKDVTKISKTMGIKDLDWRITMRLYDLDPEISELIRKIIDLLLVRQNLQNFSYDMFMCLKELAINASKANYKLLFEKHITRPQEITMQQSYFHFLRLFKEEIDLNGNKNLLELAKKDDKFINITFQSTKDAIEIWVTNTENISTIEKEQIVEKLEGKAFSSSYGDSDDDYTEGAGLGIIIIMGILKKYSKDPSPLKVIFYPGHIKVGFSLLRSELAEFKEKAEAEKKAKEQEVAEKAKESEQIEKATETKKTTAKKTKKKPSVPKKTKPKK